MINERSLLESGISGLKKEGRKYSYPFKAQWLLYVPSRLTFTNSTFCPHSVFVCFVWISKQTVNISLYRDLLSYGKAEKIGS
jgi:hypothetical protein